MAETNANVSNHRYGTTLIIAAVVVLLAIVFMYFQDRQQQRDLNLRRLEVRVELLEEWGLPRQQGLQNNLPAPTGERAF